MSAALSMPLFERPASRRIPSRDDVQAEMVEAIVRSIDRGVESAVLEAPTGFGKTATCAKTIAKLRDERGWKALFLVDERTLAEQGEEALGLWGLTPTVEMADRKAKRSLITGDIDTVIATRQTIGRKESGRIDAMLNRLAWPRIDLLVIDEAHCGIKGGQINAIREAVRPRFTLGLTATPYLASGDNLVPTFFQETAYTYSMEDGPDGEPGAISNGHLVPPHVFDCKTSVDLRGLKKSMTEWGRDYSRGELDRAIGAKVGELTNAARMDLERYGPFNRALCFTPSVDLARAFADTWSSLGYPATALYGDHPDKSGVIRRYHEGDYRVLCVCQMGTKGFDDPPTDALLMFRPTQSYPLARQMLGRGLRRSDATGKSRCLVLGAAWVADKKGPVSVLDIFLEGLPDPEVRRTAEAMARSQRGPKDMAELVKQAKHHVERKRLKIAAEKREVKHATRARSILGPVSVPAELTRFPEFSPGSRMTGEQRSRLMALGFRPGDIAGLSAVRADQHLRTWEGRPEAGMCSYKQAVYLRRLDREMPMDRILEMTTREAGAMIDRLSKGRRA